MYRSVYFVLSQYLIAGAKRIFPLAFLSHISILKFIPSCVLFILFLYFCIIILSNPVHPTGMSFNTFSGFLAIFILSSNNNISYFQCANITDEKFLILLFVFVNSSEARKKLTLHNLYLERFRPYKHHLIKFKIYQQ